MYRYHKIKSVIGILVLTLMLTGCGAGKNKLQLFSGLKADEVFKLENSVCTLAQAMIFITTERNRYEYAYTDKIWNVPMNNDGGTYKNYVLNGIRDYLTEIKCMNLMAEHNNIKLSDEEITKIREAADAFYQSLTAEDISYMGITVEDVVTAYSEYRLANKLVEELTKDVDVEVSDNEAKVITIEQIWVKDIETAQTVIEKVREEGSDFTAIAKEYSEEEQVEFQYGKGEMWPEIEDAAFALTAGQISEIVQTDNGYHIIKSVSDYDVDATQVNKGKIAKTRRSEVFMASYNAFKVGIDSKYNNKLWDSIVFQEDNKTSTMNFYDVFNQYFPPAEEAK